MQICGTQCRHIVCNVYYKIIEFFLLYDNVSSSYNLRLNKQVTKFKFNQIYILIFVVCKLCHEAEIQRKENILLFIWLEAEDSSEEGEENLGLRGINAMEILEHFWHTNHLFICLFIRNCFLEENWGETLMTRAKGPCLAPLEHYLIIHSPIQ